MAKKAPQNFREIIADIRGEGGPKVISELTGGICMNLRRISQIFNSECKESLAARRDLSFSLECQASEMFQPTRTHLPERRRLSIECEPYADAKPENLQLFLLMESMVMMKNPRFAASPCVLEYSLAHLRNALCAAICSFYHRLHSDC